MDQKLPVIVAALALLVVVGIWWEMRSPAVHDDLDAGQHEAAERSAPRAPQQRGRGNTRTDLRAKRDAWLAAREQHRQRDAPADAEWHGSMQAGRARPAGATPPAAEAERDRPTAAAEAAKRVTQALDENFEELKQVALTDPDPDERINALWSLSVGDEATALPVLASALHDGDREVRLAAVQELGGLEDERAVVDSLSIALRDNDAEVRAEAVRLIGDTEDPRAAALAGRLLNDPDDEVREEAKGVVEAAEDE